MTKLLQNSRGHRSSPASATPDSDDVPVSTRVWCSIVMVPLADFMCLAQTSFFAQGFEPDSVGYIWAAFSTFVAVAAGFLLLARSQYPELTFWIASALTLVFPFDPLLTLMSMTAYLARRSRRNTTIRTAIIGSMVTVIAQLRDALQQPEASIWHEIFSRPHTGAGSGKPIDMMVGEPIILVTAVIVALASSAASILIGLHIRSRARLREANALADAASHHVASLQSDLNNQQLADAIAAEAHDTLAHSLSLMALNASALKAEASRLEDSPEARAVADKAEDIRRQSAEALDEAHSIINMLRDPQQARKQLVPSSATSLTRESLDTLIQDTRSSGAQVNTWIDIQQLGELDDSISKVAYRVIQEGLTNAIRHAPGTPISLEVKANPTHGVHLHISNPTYPATDSYAPRGSGLSGLEVRVNSVAGQCHYGFDDRRVFHIDVQLPWRG